MHTYPKHYCGVAGVFGDLRASRFCSEALFALQHRGQESAGIVSATPLGAFHEHKSMGLVAEIFTDYILKTLPGTRAVGHTRYSTTGHSTIPNAQPIYTVLRQGPMAVAHNGNLTNTAELKRELADKGAVFQTSTDTEVLIHLIARHEASSVEAALVEVLPRLQGAYAFVILTKDTLIGVRDPFGFRPLSVGKLHDAYVFASETCALDAIGATFVREVGPGEMAIISEGPEGPVLRIQQLFPRHETRAFCIFEFVYFARPDSVLYAQNVYATRVAMGRSLAREYPIEADIVVPIPDGGVPAALGYSDATGIPLEMAFVRNHYVGRSFIQPTELGRENSARRKLALIGSAVKGKRVIVMEDSIVRGTTCRAKIGELRAAGASAVHILVSCPPHRHACVYGIDFPDASKLVAGRHTEAEICSILGADSLHYLSVAGMVSATGLPKKGFCLACFTGEYPRHYNSAAYEENLTACGK